MSFENQDNYTCEQGKENKSGEFFMIRLGHTQVDCVCQLAESVISHYICSCLYWVEMC
jgi:hypothetical protein